MRVTEESKFERRVLSIVALLLFLFVFTTFSCEHIGDYNDAVSKEQKKLEKVANNQPILSFAACGGIDYRIAPFHFFTLFIFFPS